VSQRIDLVRSSLPSSEQLVLEAVEETTHGVVLRVRAKHLPRCPACFKCRVSYHSRYARRVRDLPWQGRPVEIHLQTRRFRCLNKGCARKIFAESVPAVAARKARETTRLCEIVGLVGYALGGLPGERLLDRLGIKSSDDTVLRRVKARRRGAIQPAVRVLSVDDWAWRKKQRYGTMLMDLEQSQVIDLLPERSADGFSFHSNDARGSTQVVEPFSPDYPYPNTIMPKISPLVETKGGEIGVRTVTVPNLQSTLSLWYLHSNSELTQDGDTGGTISSEQSSNRYGLEWANYYTPAEHWAFDFDIADSRAQFTQLDSFDATVWVTNLALTATATTTTTPTPVTTTYYNGNGCPSTAPSTPIPG
jgi:hypothetical protein